MLKKTGYFILGITSLLLGIIGAFLPLLPTTVFILIAAWAFARSSDRLLQILMDNKHSGPAIRAWQANQCIPVKGKIAAVVSISISFAIVWYVTSTLVTLITLAVLIAVVVFILTRPSENAGTSVQD